MSKPGIVIANTGSPSEPTPEAVRKYLKRFLNDPRIVPLNPIAWKILLNTIILPTRSNESARKYSEIWQDEGSPLFVNMVSLANRLEAQLDGIPVNVAMSHGEPSMSNALEGLRSEGCDQLIVIPLYPQGAFSTSKIVEDRLTEALDKMNWHPDVSFIEDYCKRDDYLDAIVASVREAGFTEDDALLITFHSIPIEDVEAGDTYAEYANETAQEIAKRLGVEPERWRIGFQSRFDNRAWVGPFSYQVLRQLPVEEGKLFVVAPNFATDCLETLYDIDIAMRQEFSQHYGEADDFVYVPCLNDSDAHVDLLKALVQQS